VETDAADARRLRVLVANENAARLGELASIVAWLDHDVVAQGVDPVEVGRLTRSARPDVALVGLAESREHALSLISRIVHEATCPVIAVLRDQEPAFVAEAAKRGIFAYITHDDAEQLEGSVSIVLQRYAEFRNLAGAFERRALIERAKGILMERHGVDERQAFAMLRDHSHRTHRKLADIAEAVAESHLLLPGIPLQEQWQ
jgi:response regulator NasT